jgi:hypothetical protein
MQQNSLHKFDEAPSPEQQRAIAEEEILDEAILSVRLGYQSIR